MGLCFISRKGAVGCSRWISRIGDAVGCSICTSRRSVAGLCSGLISRKVAAAAGSPNNLGVYDVQKWSWGKEGNLQDRAGTGGVRGVSTAVEGGTVEKAVVNCGAKISSPCLMLPSDFEKGGSNMVYNFYSLAENKEFSLNNEKKRCGEDDSMAPDGDIKVVGSSHGWLALFNKRNNHIFLSNPLSGRHIKLPPVDTLPFPGFKCLKPHEVTKLIISSSPEEDEEHCRAMILYGPSGRLAFCCPGHSTKWIRISEKASYKDFVYSSRKKLFFCAPNFGMGFEAWDLREPQSPRLIPMDVSMDRINIYPYSERSLEVMTAISDDMESWSSINFLAVAEHSDELFLVRRHRLQRIGST